MLFNPAQPQPQAQSGEQPRYSNGGTVVEFPLTSSPSILVPDRTTTNNRRNLMVFNTGTANALIAYGTSISPTVFTIELLPGGYFADSPSAPWQGPVVARATGAATKVTATELVLI
jgi:hypothetical protein